MKQQASKKPPVMKSKSGSPLVVAKSVQAKKVKQKAMPKKAEPKKAEKPKVVEAKSVPPNKSAPMPPPPKKALLPPPAPKLPPARDRESVAERSSSWKDPSSKFREAASQAAA